MCSHPCYLLAAEVGKEGRRVTILVSSIGVIVTIIATMFFVFFPNVSIIFSQVALHVVCPIQHTCDSDSGMIGIIILMLSDIASLQVLNVLPLSNFPSTHNDRHSVGNVEADWWMCLPTYFSNMHF